MCPKCRIFVRRLGHIFLCGQRINARVFGEVACVFERIVKRVRQGQEASGSEWEKTSKKYTKIDNF